MISDVRPQTCIKHMPLQPEHTSIQDIFLLTYTNKLFNEKAQTKTIITLSCIVVPLRLRNSIRVRHPQNLFTHF
jgi:hypothetical protein